MHIIFAARGGTIAEPRGHGFDRSHRHLFAGALIAGWSGRGQFAHGEKRASPGPEILGGEFNAGNFANVAVDAGGFDGANFAIFPDIFEELVTGEFLAPANDGGEATVGEFDVVLLAALPAGAELETGAGNADVAVLEGGEAERVVFARLFIVAHANEAGFEQANHRGEDFFLRQPRPL